MYSFLLKINPDKLVNPSFDVLHILEPVQQPFKLYIYSFINWIHFSWMLQVTSEMSIELSFHWTPKRKPHKFIFKFASLNILCL